MSYGWGHSIILCDSESVTVTSRVEAGSLKYYCIFSDRLHDTVALSTKLKKDEINVIQFQGCP